jgi:glycosyltransferase involved in cell wall biosynthesis
LDVSVIPKASVIIPAYRAAPQLDVALRSLERQSYSGAFEVLVINSGGLTYEYRAERPNMAVRILDFEERLWPGAARNAGLHAARGEIIAFMPADALAARSWLAERIAAHEDGADLVGGAILNGRPHNFIATAEYLLEYSALMPNASLLREQGIPHALSFKSRVFDVVGAYPEETTTGEDTIFNGRCLDAGLKVAFAPKAGLAHLGSKSLGEMYRHAFAHGVGLMQCVETFGLKSSVGSPEQNLGAAAFRMLVVYPVAGLIAKFRRLARFAPGCLPGYFALLPLIFSAQVATGAGALFEYYRRGDPD